jgi:uncharacterized paraquat-inducible protein A
MKNKKWLISAVLALIIVAAITLYTEAYLDMGRNAVMLFVAFAGITLVLRFLLACFAAIKSAAPQVKQQLNGEGAYAATVQRTTEADPTPRCPKCGSTSISADKKGFGVGKAVMGAAVAGPVGLVAGNIGAKKVRITCLNCGHHWEAGKA